MSESKTMQQVLDETRDFIVTKQASFGKKAKEEALDNPGAIPGSNHDKPIPEGSQTADAEVQQELPANSANNASGATEAEKLESGHATDALTPVQNVTEKAMVTDDAMVAEASSGASKHASDLVSLIGAFKEKSTEKVAADSEVAVCEECKNAECTCDKKEEKKEAANPGNEIELTQEVLSKIACTILSTEEGCAFTEKLLQKEAGAQAAKDTMEFLQKQAADAEKQASYEQGLSDADNLIQNAVKQAAFEEGRQSVLQASAQPNYTALGAQVAQAAVKRAQAEMGIDPAALAAEAPMEDPMAAMGEDPMAAMGGEEVPGAEEALAGMTGDGEEGADISPEELEQALAMMVESGELSEEDIAAILEQVGASEGAGEAGEALAMMGGGEEAPVAEEIPEEMEVAASASIEQSFLNSLAAVRASK